MRTIGEGATLANLENGTKDTSSAEPFSASPNFNWDGDDDEAHHVDHHFPKSLLLFPRQVDEDITFWVLKQLEGDGQVMVLQHGLVVVHERELRAGVDEVLVRQPRMVDVVNSRGEDGRHDLQGSENGLKLGK